MSIRAQQIESKWRCPDDTCRIDTADGGWYTKGEFLAFYGSLNKYETAPEQDPEYIRRMEQQEYEIIKLIC